MIANVKNNRFEYESKNIKFENTNGRSMHKGILVNLMQFFYST